jgi:uncharacterized protein YbjT (DUF2867 family)
MWANCACGDGAFLKQTDARLTLFLRRAKRLKFDSNKGRVRVVEGDVLDLDALDAVMVGQDVVYANLSGSMEQQANNIVRAMNAHGVKRLIFIRRKRGQATFF